MYPIFTVIISHYVKFSRYNLNISDDRQSFHKVYQISSSSGSSVITMKPEVTYGIRGTATLFHILHNLTLIKDPYFSKIYCHTITEIWHTH
jgi:hypothetical protein